MKCPVCHTEMDSMVCTCGYDESRNYEKYPTLGRLPVGVVSVAGQRQQGLIRCGGCGSHGFFLDIQQKKLCCLRCGRALQEPELELLRRAMGWEQEPDPNRIVAIDGGRDHTVALYADGTAAAIGDNQYGQCSVSEWRDIVAISARCYHTIGVKKDGTVVVTGNDFGNRNKAASAWTDIVEVADGTFHTVGRTGSGTAVAVGDKTGGKLDVSDWRDLQAIAASSGYTIGLRDDGTVVTAGWGNLAQHEFSSWQDITAIATSDFCTVGLHQNGTVRYVGINCKGIDAWSQIADVKAGSRHIVGLKKDDTAVAVGSNVDGRCAVDSWHDLEAIAAGDNHTIGLKKDGTLVATGDNSKGQCEVQKLVRQK